MQKFLIAACSAAAVVAFTGMTPASASPYSQGIRENGIGTFDDIQAFVFAPNGNLALTGFSGPSWSSVAHGPRWSEATGDASTTDLTFLISLDFVNAPFTYDFFAFRQGVIVDSATFTTDGTQVTQVVDPIDAAASAYAADVLQAVPEPISLASLGVGILGLGLFYRRKAA